MAFGAIKSLKAAGRSVGINALSEAHAMIERGELEGTVLNKAVKNLLDLQEKYILLDDVEKYFEEKLSLEERQNLEKIMKKYKKMEL